MSRGFEKQRVIAGRSVALMSIMPAAFVTACGDGGINSPSTIVPTPTPTPTLTGTLASQTFATEAASTTATINNATGAVSNATATEAAFGAFSLSYDASANAYTVNDGGASHIFSSSDASGSDLNFRFFAQTTGATTNQLALFTPGSTNSRLALTYTSYGAWTTSMQGATATSITGRFFAYGVQTAGSNMPTTGSATYTGVVDGAAAISGQSYRLVGSTASLTANFATGGITTTISLVGNPNISSTAVGTIALGTLNGTASIASGSNSYSGTLSGLNTSGTLNGAFFGPRAAETGYSFATNGNGNNVVGVFVGKP